LANSNVKPVTSSLAEKEKSLLWLWKRKSIRISSKCTKYLMAHDKQRFDF